MEIIYSGAQFIQDINATTLEFHIIRNIAVHVWIIKIISRHSNTIYKIELLEIKLIHINCK